MSRIGLKFSQMILHTSTSKMMNNLPFLLVVLHKPTLWPSTFKVPISGAFMVLLKKSQKHWPKEKFHLAKYFFYHSNTSITVLTNQV